MKRKNILFGIAVIVLLVIFGWQWKEDHTSQELITHMEVDIDDQLRDFLEREISVWQAALAAHESIGTQPDLNLYILIAFNAKNVGDLQVAKEAYDKYFDVHTVNYSAYNSYGSLLRRMGDLEGAEDAYRTAISLNDDVEDYYMDLAQVLTEMGRDEELEDVYKEAIDKAGRSRALVVALARWYADAGYCEDAISHYEVAINLEENEGIVASIKEDLAEVEASCQL